MEIVIDSNVVFRILLSKGEVLRLLFDNKLEPLAPEHLKREFARNRDELAARSRLDSKEFDELRDIVYKRIEFIPKRDYEGFISETEKVLGEHSKDEDFIALCIMRGLKLWTYEKRLLRTDYGISTEKLTEMLEKA
mgnify:CR=1 FL=1